MQALYAFCRIADDIVDESWEPLIKQKQLEFWRSQIRVALTAESRHPMTMEMAFLMREFGVTADELTTLLDGVAADCHDVAPQTRNDLECYCYGVASIVGIMCLRIFGVILTSEAREGAVQLGYAFQCTNILRDVAVDAAQARCYFPREELAEFQLSPETLVDPANRDRARAFLVQQCATTWQYFKKAWSTFPQADLSKLYPARVMSLYYETIFKKITANPAVVLERPVGLSLPHKLWLFLRAGFLKS
jgi:phytoene synthase